MEQNSPAQQQAFAECEGLGMEGRVTRHEFDSRRCQDPTNLLGRLSNKPLPDRNIGAPAVERTSPVLVKRGERSTGMAKACKLITSDTSSSADQTSLVIASSSAGLVTTVRMRVGTTATGA